MFRCAVWGEGVVVVECSDHVMGVVLMLKWRAYESWSEMHVNGSLRIRRSLCAEIWGMWETDRYLERATGGIEEDAFAYTYEHCRRELIGPA